MTRQYYAIRWQHVLKLTEHKVVSPKVACMETFGMATRDMKVKPLGGVTAKVQSLDWFMQQVSSDEGWLNIKGEKYIGMDGA